MKAASTIPRTQLGRSEWIEAATSVLAEKGVEGMRVEVLAKHCGVTKGSFYWHFKDRQDLFDSVLQNWKEGRLRDIDKQSTVTPGQERELLRQIIEIYSANRNRRGIAIELAVRDWARRNALAAKVVSEVDIYRLDRARQLFVASGLRDDEAKSRSLLLYAYVFGQSLMACDGFDPKLTDLRRWIAERIVAD